MKTTIITGFLWGIFIVKQEIGDVNQWLDTVSYPQAHLFEESWREACEQYSELLIWHKSRCRNFRRNIFKNRVIGERLKARNIPAQRIALG